DLPEGRVTSVAFRPDGKALTAGFTEANSLDKGRVMLWELTDGKWRGTTPLAVPEGPVQNLVFRSDGMVLAAGYGGALAPFSGKGGVTVWKMADKGPKSMSGLRC